MVVVVVVIDPELGDSLVVSRASGALGQRVDFIPDMAISQTWVPTRAVIDQVPEGLGNPVSLNGLICKWWEPDSIDWGS